MESIPGVEQLLKKGTSVIVLAPSYVIVAEKKYNCTPEQFCTALRKLGFSKVYESSFGADVVTKVYADYLKKEVGRKGKENVHIITSPCPSLMNLIEKHFPELIPEFAPVMSPLAVQATLARRWNSGNVTVVAASPCIAKKSELLDEKMPFCEEALTFEELITMLDDRGIVPSNLPETEFDGIQALYGAGFSISGGLTKTLEVFSSELKTDFIGNDVLVLEGEYRSYEFLKEMAAQKKAGNLKWYPTLIDILFCEGCTAGRAMGVDCNLLEAKRIVAAYTQKRWDKVKGHGLLKRHAGYTVAVKNTVEAPKFKRWVDIIIELIAANKFTRSWENRRYNRKMPSVAELQAELEKDGRYTKEDELNCHACGYESCRERAIAAFNGEGVVAGCPVHQRELAEEQHLKAEKARATLLENVESLLAAIGEIAEGNQDNAATSLEMAQSVTEIAEQTKILGLNAQVVAKLTKGFEQVGELATSQAAVTQEIAISSEELHATAESLKSIH